MSSIVHSVSLRADDAFCRSDGRTGRTVVRGLLKNFNTIEDFKKVDKQVLFNDFSDQVRPVFCATFLPTD